MRVLIAPSGFKESLDAPEIAAAIAAGVRAAAPSSSIRVAPIADGGEGFARALADATGGDLLPITVCGPTGQPVESHVGRCGGGDGTHVVEMAAAAGLRLVPPGARNPMHTTTFGVGQLLRGALDAGARRIVVGCGDSGTNDGGMGMAAALGVRFLDRSGAVLRPTGEHLGRVHDIDLRDRDERALTMPVDVACNVHNVLCGDRGVARVYGPQKGATPEQVRELATGLEVYARAVERATGVSVDTIPGGGASGGLGAALTAFLGARLLPRWDVIARYFDVERLLDWADLVFTAEGSLDGQTPNGKIPAELGRRARERSIPVVALAGRLGEGVEHASECGISAYTSIVQGPCTLGEAMGSTERFVAAAAEQAMRMVMVGRALAA